MCLACGIEHGDHVSTEGRSQVPREKKTRNAVTVGYELLTTALHLLQTSGGCRRTGDTRAGRENILRNLVPSIGTLPGSPCTRLPGKTRARVPALAPTRPPVAHATTPHLLARPSLPNRRHALLQLRELP